MLIFLLGFMGSGKSFCGKRIAANFDVPFFDLDHEIESSEKKSIKELFDVKGENVFRQIESAVLIDLVNKNNINSNQVSGVIACGGGTPCYHGNVEFMNQNGLTVWLDPSIETLIKRLKPGKSHRPLIENFSDAELEAFIHSKLSERAMYYGQAKMHYEGNDCPLDQVKTFLNNE